VDIYLISLKECNCLAQSFRHWSVIMCGVIGIINCFQSAANQDDFPPVSYDVYRGLLNLQHRGQDAAGILSYNFSHNNFSVHKQLGLVNEVFNEKNLDSLTGQMAIGHTRYATAGSDSVNDIQPLVAGFPMGIGMAHNGNVVNYHRLAEFVNKTHNRQLLTKNDLEIFLSFWCQSLMCEQGGDLFDRAKQAASNIFEAVIGGYAVVGLIAGKGMFAMRDPQGIRPLVLAKDDQNRYAFSSETNSLETLGFEIQRSVTPGELIFISIEGEVQSFKFSNQMTSKPCMFEWVYFAGAESSIEDRPVYGVRRNLGVRLGHKVSELIGRGEISPDIVCPVPDTSRSSAIALAEFLKLTYREALIKNRYVQRSFILKTQEHREKAVELKLNPVRSEIEGKNILLVDDSVVRGTTSRRIVQLLKSCGAKEVYLAVTCPPTTHGCFYGVDFPSNEELIANGKTIKEVESEIGADRVVYLEEKDLKIATGLNNMCMACVNGQYPTCTADAMEFSQRRNEYKEVKV
jgi:amidophosphoribosyltransferase